MPFLLGFNYTVLFFTISIIFTGKWMQGLAKIDIPTPTINVHKINVTFVVHRFQPGEHSWTHIYVSPYILLLWVVTLFVSGHQQESTISDWGWTFQTCRLATYPSNYSIISLYTYFQKSLFDELFYPNPASWFWREIGPASSMSYHDITTHGTGLGIIRTQPHHRHMMKVLRIRKKWVIRKHNNKNKIIFD